MCKFGFRNAMCRRVLEKVRESTCSNLLSFQATQVQVMWDLEEEREGRNDGMGNGEFNLGKNWGNDILKDRGERKKAPTILFLA